LKVNVVDSLCNFTRALCCAHRFGYRAGSVHQNIRERRKEPHFALIADFGLWSELRQGAANEVQTLG
jgi:hypothetical protein